MGHRITQTIHTCDVCGKIPEDGEHLWHMGNQIWCEECCKNDVEDDYGVQLEYEANKLNAI